MLLLAGAHELRRLVEDRGEVRVVGGGPGIAAALESARGTAAELEAGRGEEGLQAAEEGAAHGGRLSWGRRGGGLFCRGGSVRV